MMNDDVSKCLDDGSVVDLIMFDFGKAFDSASHPILLTKLRLLGFDVHLIRWIEDSLVGRKMSVSVKGMSSRPHWSPVESLRVQSLVQSFS